MFTPMYFSIFSAFGICINSRQDENVVILYGDISKIDRLDFNIELICFETSNSENFTERKSRSFFSMYSCTCIENLWRNFMIDHQMYIMIDRHGIWYYRLKNTNYTSNITSFHPITSYHKRTEKLYIKSLNRSFDILTRGIWVIIR